MDSDLGAKVKKLRIAHGLTQEDLTGVSLDYLAGSVDKSYQNTALDNEIMQIVQKLDVDSKEKLISTLRIWFAENK